MVSIAFTLGYIVINYVMMTIRDHPQNQKDCFASTIIDITPDSVVQLRYGCVERRWAKQMRTGSIRL